MGNSLSFRNQEMNNNNHPNGLPTTTSRLNLIFNNLIPNSNTGNSGSSTGTDKKRQKSIQLNNVSFATHFFIAGRKFKNIVNQAQAFLFGDQLDLSFILAHKPVIFPYDTPSVEEPSKYLQSLINIRKDTIRLVKCVPNNIDDNTHYDSTANKYNIEFRFDCDCDVRINILYFAHEKFTSSTTNSNNNEQLIYTCGCSNNAKSSNNTKTCFCLNNHDSKVYAKGANIQFQNLNHVIIPAQFDYKAWQFNIHANYFPLVIECTPINTQLFPRHAHITLAYIDKCPTLNSPNANIPNDQKMLTLTSSYQIKPIKQKQLIDGVLYSLQEIYGIEKKISTDTELTSTTTTTTTTSVSCSITSSSITTQNSNLSQVSNNINGGEGDMVMSVLDTQQEMLARKREAEQEIEQEMKGIECVICMCETRDTLILPCRHLCLCKLCAINLRVQSNNCPICRIPFIALLQLKLVKKKIPTPTNVELQPHTTNNNNHLPIVRMENLPIVRLHKTLNNSNSLDISHENVIIEESFQINERQCQDASGLLCINKPDSLVPSLCMSMYETVSIYEAFNSSPPSHVVLDEQTQSRLLASNKSKRFKIKILDPIRSSSDFVVQNINEVESGVNKIPKLFEIQNISAQKESLSLRGAHDQSKNDLRCSSVVLNRTINESPDKSFLRSTSYIGNFRQMNKFSDGIQMEEVAPSDMIH